jgi:hypothetical protein
MMAKGEKGREISIFQPFVDSSEPEFNMHRTPPPEGGVRIITKRKY